MGDATDATGGVAERTRISGMLIALTAITVTIDTHKLPRRV